MLVEGLSFTHPSGVDCYNVGVVILVVVEIQHPLLGDGRVGFEGPDTGALAALLGQLRRLEGCISPW